MTKNFLMPALALAGALTTGQVGAATLTMPTPLGSLEGHRVIVDGVDVTAFAQIEGGILQISLSTDLAQRPMVTIIGPNDDVVVEMTGVDQSSTDLSVNVTSDFAIDQPASHALEAETSALYSRRGWTVGGSLSLAGQNEVQPLDARSAKLFASKALDNGRLMEFDLGTTDHTLGNQIAAESLSGRGIRLAFSGPKLEVGFIALGANNPAGFRDEEHRFSEKAYRRGLSLRYRHESESLSLAVGLQRLGWSDDQDGEHIPGDAWGATVEARHTGWDLGVRGDWAESNTTAKGRGQAYMLAFDAAFELGPVPLSVTLSYGHADPTIDFPETFWPEDLQTSAFEVSTDLSWGSLMFRRETARDNVWDVPANLTTQTRITAFSINLTQMPQELSFVEGVTFEATREEAQALNASTYLAVTGDDPAYLPDARYDGLSLGADFALRHGSGNVTLTYGFYDEGMPAVHDADTRERSIELSRSWQFDILSLDLRARYDKRQDLSPEARNVSQTWDYGVALAWFPEDLPQVSLDLSVIRAKDDDQSYGQASWTKDETLSLAADLSPWLHDMGLNEAMTASFFYTQTRSTSDASVDTTSGAGLQIAMAF